MNDLDDRLASLLLSLARALHERVKRAPGAKNRLTPPQIKALSCIAEVPGAKPGTLAEYVCLAPASATALLDGLVKSGYVTRRRDAEDRRIVRLALTPKGARALSARLARVKEALAALTARLSSADRRALAVLLERLVTETSA